VIHLNWHLHRKTAPREASRSLRGVDVASFQGTPAQWRGEAGAIDFAEVKFTELSAGGAYVNPDAAADWAWLKQQGHGRIAYLYPHPSVSVSATAGLFVSELRRLGLDDDDGVMLDHEQSDGLGPAAVNTWALAVCRLLERELGRRPLVYTYLSFAWEGNCASLGGYPLAISDPSSPAGHPRVPDPWHSWAVHQYAVSPIDRDLAAYPSLAAMASALGKREAAPKPRPKPAPAPRILEEEPVLLLSQGVPMPVAIPDRCRALRFVAAQAAELQVHFRTEASARPLSVSWEGHATSEGVPAGCVAALVTRTDGGPGAVSACFVG
jgi:lysozyme